MKWVSAKRFNLWSLYVRWSWRIIQEDRSSSVCHSRHYLIGSASLSCGRLICMWSRIMVTVMPGKGWHFLYPCFTISDSTGWQDINHTVFEIIFFVRAVPSLIKTYRARSLQVIQTLSCYLIGRINEWKTDSIKINSIFPVRRSGYVTLSFIDSTNQIAR